MYQQRCPKYPHTSDYEFKGTVISITRLGVSILLFYCHAVIGSSVYKNEHGSFGIQSCRYISFFKACIDMPIIILNIDYNQYSIYCPTPRLDWDV